MTARYPYGTIKLLPEDASQPDIIPIGVIIHSAAGMSSPYRYFLNSTDLESTFWVSADGNTEQYMDVTTRADANRYANRFQGADGRWYGYISVETASDVNATDPFYDAQYRELVRLVTWLCDTFNIPAVQCPTSKSPGIGWHIMWGAPGDWTPVAKSCPGPTRITQVRDHLIHDVAAALAAPSAQEGFLMALTDKQQGELYLWTKALHDDYGKPGGAGGPMRELLKQMKVLVYGIYKKVVG
jgi:hypothetical protein